MKVTLRTIALGLLCATATTGLAGQGTTPTADEILARLDANSSFKSIRYAGRMEITIGGETRVKSMEVVAIASGAGAGTDKALIEFTNPEDRGIRYLKLAKELWMYFPKEADTVKISGHLLKEGMMGSDVSYEDALESSDFKAKYLASVKGSEDIDGRKAWILELVAKLPTAPYDRILMWLDAERFVMMKEEMYAKSGRLLKVSTTLESKRIGNRWFATSVVTESKLRKNTKTAFVMEKLELDVALDPRQFSLAALTK
ncbi:MAG: outer membrane lipoprotein-sorting protein [Spirochaetota bacterium]